MCKTINKGRRCHRSLGRCTKTRGSPPEALLVIRSSAFTPILFLSFFHHLFTPCNGAKSLVLVICAHPHKFIVSYHLLNLYSNISCKSLFPWSNKKRSKFSARKYEPEKWSYGFSNKWLTTICQIVSLENSFLHHLEGLYEFFESQFRHPSVKLCLLITFQIAGVEAATSTKVDVSSDRRSLKREL